MELKDSFANGQQSINVVVRMRPPFASEVEAPWNLDPKRNSIKLSVQADKSGQNEEPMVRAINNQKNQQQRRQLGDLPENQIIDGQKTTKSTYLFDKVFPQQSSNEQVYEESCKSIIEKVLDGYNGTIFAYGQTTSGKTHTMVGCQREKESGIMQLAMEQIFRYIQQVQEDRDIFIWGSYLELYNEMINDLVDQHNSNLKIREDPQTGYYVSGLKSIRLFSMDDVQKIMMLGERSKHYRKTDIHEKSSRSHTIFTLLIENRLKDQKRIVSDEQMMDKQNETPEQILHVSYGTKYSILNIVDLAGSERISESGAHNLEETSHINSSLFVLANVINKLSESKKETHIPYRNSKITQILKSALGGNSLTTIICTISPHQDHVNLSFSTLRFASRAKQIKNSVKVNEVIDDHELLQFYKKKVIMLERKVNQLELQLAEKKEKEKGQVEAQNKAQEGEEDEDELDIGISQGQKVYDLKFEIQNLQIDNKNLQEAYERERQTAEVYMKLYQNLMAREQKETKEIETQTGTGDQLELFCQIVNRVKIDNDLMEIKITDTKQTGLIYEYLDFQEKVKKTFESVPMRSEIDQMFKARDANRNRTSIPSKPSSELSPESKQSSDYSPPSKIVPQESPKSAFPLQKQKTAQIIEVQECDELMEESNRNLEVTQKQESLSFVQVKQQNGQEMINLVQEKPQMKITSPTKMEREKIRKDGIVFAENQKIRMAEEGKVLLQPNSNQSQMHQKKPYRMSSMTPINQNHPDVQYANQNEQQLTSHYSTNNLDPATQAKNENRILQSSKLSYNAANQKGRSKQSYNSAQSQNQNAKSYQSARPNTKGPVAAHKEFRISKQIKKDEPNRQLGSTQTKIAGNRTPMLPKDEELKAYEQKEKKSSSEEEEEQVSTQIVNDDIDSCQNALFNEAWSNYKHKKALIQEEEKLKVPDALQQRMRRNSERKSKNSHRRKLDDSSMIKDGEEVNLSLIEMEEDDELEFNLQPDEELEDLRQCALDDISLSIYSKQDTQKMIQNKWQLLKEMKELLEQDLEQKVKYQFQGGENVYFFGDNRDGRCGIGIGGDHVVHPQPLKHKLKTIVCGFSHNAGLDKHKVLYTWGKNQYGQLGQGEDDDYMNVPTLVQGPLNSVIIDTVTCGWLHTLATTQNGFLFAWGLNIFGQLGLGDYVDRYYPEQVKGLATQRIREVSASQMHSGVITQEGKLYTWGANTDCRLFRKIEYYQSGRPKQFCFPQYCHEFNQKLEAVKISCGYSHTLVLDKAGEVYAAGSPENGQLGVLHYEFTPKTCKIPYIKIMLFTQQHRAAKVCAGDGFSVFLDEHGDVYTTGKGNFGRLGQGDQDNIALPKKIQFFAQKGIGIKDISVGGRHSLAITRGEEPELYGWGFNYYNQFGLGSDTEDRLEPAKIPVTAGEGMKLKKIGCGYFHSCYVLK